MFGSLSPTNTIPMLGLLLRVQAPETPENPNLAHAHRVLGSLSSVNTIPMLGCVTINSLILMVMIDVYK